MKNRTIRRIIAVFLMMTGVVPAEEKVQLRVLCASILDAPVSLTLAAKGEGDAWKNLATVEARDSFISDWLPAQAGELHLTVRKDGVAQSIGHFTVPQEIQRGFLLVAADAVNHTYQLHWLDAEQAGFTKGKVFAVNFTKQAATVSFGKTEVKLEAGKTLTVTPEPEENGMFRVQVSRPGADGKTEPCYDRYQPHSKESRELFFLLADPQTGVRVAGLSLFADP